MKDALFNVILWSVNKQSSVPSFNSTNNPMPANIFVPPPVPVDSSNNTGYFTPASNGTANEHQEPSSNGPITNPLSYNPQMTAPVQASTQQRKKFTRR